MREQKWQKNENLYKLFEAIVSKSEIRITTYYIESDIKRNGAVLNAHFKYFGTLTRTYVRTYAIYECTEHNF